MSEDKVMQLIEILDRELGKILVKQANEKVKELGLFRKENENE